MTSKRFAVEVRLLYAYTFIRMKQIQLNVLDVFRRELTNKKFRRRTFLSNVVYLR